MNDTTAPATLIEEIKDFHGADLDDLMAATKEAIVEGQGFGWLRPPPRDKLESYWKGVLLVPERSLFVARLNGTIVGTIQLVLPPANNEAGAFCGELSTFFVVPWARGFGLARGLLRQIEMAAVERGLLQLDFHARADRKAAISLCENAGFQRWGVKQRYALVDGKFIAGYYYSKALDQEPT